MVQKADIARALVHARLHDQVLDRYPGALPETLSDAYAIQDAGIAQMGRAIGGWKIGRIRPDDVAHYGANRLAGPIFSDMIVEAVAGEEVQMPILQGFAAAEAELLLRLGQVPPAGASAADMLDCIDEVRFGLEIASSPFTGINDNGPAVTISDFGNNHGLVLGPVVENWHDPAVINAVATLSIDGQQIGSGSAEDMLDGPFGAVAFLAQLMHQRGGNLAAGQWISTGAITGVHPIGRGQRARATFANALEVACVTCVFEPAIAETDVA